MDAQEFEEAVIICRQSSYSRAGRYMLGFLPFFGYWSLSAHCVYLDKAKHLVLAPYSGLLAVAYALVGVFFFFA